MDRQIRWLRRYVLWRVLRRLSMEAAVSAFAVTGVALALTTSFVTACILGAVAAHGVVIGRLTTALITGPVNVGYLLTWENVTGDLQTSSSTDRPEARHDEALDDTGFRFITALSWGEEPSSDDGYALYGVDSGLVMICAGLDDEPMVVLSRMSDGRLLLSTGEVVPPFESILVQWSESTEIEALVARHTDAIADLHRNGIGLATVGPDAVSEYLEAEWNAWEQLGPFVGSFLRVSTSRRIFSLDVRLPTARLWNRSVRSAAIQATSPQTTIVDTAFPPAASPQAAPSEAVAAHPTSTPNSAAGRGATTSGHYPPGIAPSWTTKQRTPSQPIGSAT